MLISVIISFYNSANYIARCLNSILCQDLSDVEILCVDDGSTDDSCALLNQLLEQSDKKQHVQVLKIDKNHGPAYARNLGVQNAKGDYVIYIDSDDYVSPDYFSVLKHIIEESEPDAVIFNFLELRKNNEQILKVTDCEESSEKMVHGLLLNKFHNSVCNKLFKRSLYTEHQISFPTEYMYFEDKAVCFKLLYFSKVIRIINHTLYFYDRTNENSITSKKFNMLFDSSVGAFSTIEHFFSDKQISPSTKDALLANKMFVSGFLYLFGKRGDIKKHRSFLTRIPNRIIFKYGNFPFYYRLAVFFSQNHLSVFTKCLEFLYQSIKGVR